MQTVEKQTAEERIKRLESRLLYLSNEFRNFKRKIEVPAKLKIGDDYNGHKIVHVEWVLRQTYEGTESYDWKYTYSTDKGLQTFWHSPDFL